MANNLIFLHQCGGDSRSGLSDALDKLLFPTIVGGDCNARSRISLKLGDDPLLYQPNFSTLSGAIEQALHSKNKKQHYQWRVASISQSKQSSSIYAYLLRHGRLTLLRLSDHKAPDDSAYRVDCFIPHPDSGYALHSYLSRNKGSILNALNSASVKLSLSLLLIAKAIAKTYKTNETFLWRYGHLYITHPRREIVDSAVINDVKYLIAIGLLVCREDGHLSVTHNGLTILKKYPEYSRVEWPETLSGYSCDELLTKLEHHLRRKIAWQASSKLLTPPIGWNATPKIWRDWGKTVAESHDWYPYRLLKIISPARRRSLYIYLYSPREARLALLRIGTSKIERTKVEELPQKVSNTLVVPDKNLKWLKKVVGQITAQGLIDSNFKAFHLHLLHFAWLKMVAWVSKHHAKIGLKGEGVSIVKRDHNGHLQAVYCLPGNQKHWLNELEQARMVRITNKPRLTELGQMVLDQYETTCPYQDSQWKKNLLAAPSRYDLLHMLSANN